MGILALWVAFGLSESAKSVVTYGLRGEPRGWADALIANMPWWLAWAAATPLVFLVARRFPLERGRWGWSLAVQLPLSFAVSAAHILVVGWLYFHTVVRGTTSPRGAVLTLDLVLGNWFDNWLIMNWFTYWTLVGLWYLGWFYRQTRARQTEAARLEARAAQLEASMRQARLDALRMELNPHFLFNALNAVSGLVRRRENAGAVVMLARLGDLLRVTLAQDARQEVALDDELMMLEHYLGIEQVRFHDRLAVEREIAPETRRMLVPALILQPLVENAIRHGVARSTRPGRVLLRSRSDGLTLAVEIEDSGKGFPDGPRREGIGLTNTRERLQQLYGEAGALRLESMPGGGGRATVVVPVHYSEEDLRVGLGA